MAEADNENAAPSGSRFGSCCKELEEAMAGEDFEPLLTEGNDGVLYMAVGLVDLEDEETGMVDHPLFFCPFCGTRLQTADEVKSRVEAVGTAENGEGRA
jgi:hypothetical protein